MQIFNSVKLKYPRDMMVVNF